MLGTLLFTPLSPFLRYTYAAASGGDLSISDGGISFSTAGYLQGRTTRIWIIVNNNSTADLLGSVRVSVNGKGVAPDQPVSILAGKTDDVFVDWVPGAIGSYKLTVSIIPWISEGDNPANNAITKDVYVEQDTDRDGIPDSKDDDKDGDGTLNTNDAFPLDAKENLDTDGDSIGNNADPDDDNDGILDVDDAFPEDPLYSKDMDKDGTPDETDEDIDGDSINNTAEENLGLNPLLTDTDGDKVGDGEDPFPLDQKEWSDLDSDGIGDNSDTDIDGDGISNTEDKNPSDKAPIAAVSDKALLADINEEVTFDASASSDDTGITKYVWIINGETTEQATVKKVFPESGLQIATLTVYDASEQSDSIEVRVRIYDFVFLAKIAGFSFLLILLAFYIIYRYNRAAFKPTKEVEAAKPVIKPVTNEKRNSPKVLLGSGNKVRKLRKSVQSGVNKRKHSS
jgi:hypothetical protein